MYKSVKESILQKKIQTLQKKLDDLLACEPIDSNRVLELSKELDSLIVEEIKTKCASLTQF